MNRIASYLKTGKGLGLLIVLAVSLLFGLLAGYGNHRSAQQLMAHPMTTDFVDNFPVLTVKDGIIQESDIQWARMIPFTQIPLIIDTGKDTITFPENPTPSNAVYITRLGRYQVMNGTVDYLEFAQNENLKQVTLSPSEFLPFSSTTGLKWGVATFISTWLFYLACVFFTAILAWLFRVSLANKRVWRVTAFVLAIGSLLILIALAIPYSRDLAQVVLSTMLCWIIPVLFNLIILSTAQNRVKII